MYVGFAEEQRQTLDPVKRVEVVNTLMKPVHAVLVLTTHQTDLNIVTACTNEKNP